MSNFTPAQIAELTSRVTQARAIAAKLGRKHPLWDAIYDAESLLLGETNALCGRTLLEGSKQEVYDQLLDILPSA